MSQDREREDGGRPEGRYANYIEVGHNAFEFVMDFGQLYADSSSARIHTRVITGPGYAKALLMTLQDAIDQYEEVFGPITEDSENQNEH